jgi:hypothetical protein
MGQFRAKIVIQCALVICCLVGSAYAKGWAEAISEVEARSRFLWNYGIERGASSHLGSIYNELDANRHQCAIAGRLLGLENNIRHLEEMPEPKLSDDMNEDQLMELMLYSHSLSNWVVAAKYLAGLPMDEVAEIWNLNCVGKLEIDGMAFVDSGVGRAKFKQDGTRVRVLGDIDLGFASELESWLIANPQTEEVVLGSGGGSVKDAILAGIAIRQRGLNTTLSDSCFSACPLVFIGGVNRTIWSPYPPLGFHQAYTVDGIAIPASSEIYQMIFEYSNMMGVDGNFVLESMMNAGPMDMFEPHIDELCASKVVTWVQRACF